MSDEPRLVSEGAPMNGAEVILRERVRQIAEEGHDLDYDYVYPPGTLALAGAAYAVRAFNVPSPAVPEIWPWDPNSWKPKEDPMRNLARAGALIAAEIDRLLRMRRAWPAPYPGTEGERSAGNLAVKLDAMTESHEELDRHCVELQRELDAAHGLIRELRAQEEDYGELREATGRLVEHLDGAWWLAAAEAYNEIKLHLALPVDLPDEPE